MPQVGTTSELKGDQNTVTMNRKNIQSLSEEDSLHHLRAIIIQGVIAVPFQTGDLHRRNAIADRVAPD